MSTPKAATSARDDVRKVAPKLIMAFYSGWPTAMTAGRIARKIFEEAK